MSATQPPAAGPRRWLADPLLTMGVLALGCATAITLVLGSTTHPLPGWQVPALAGVVAAGLSLSGST